MLESSADVVGSPVDVRGSQLRGAVLQAEFSPGFVQDPELRELLVQIAQLLPDGSLNPESIYVIASIVTAVEGYESSVLPKILNSFGAACDCPQLTQRLEAIAALGPLNEDGLNSAQLDLGAALEAIVTLAERGTDRSGQFAASLAVRLASTRPEIAVALAVSTCDVIAKRRFPLPQGLSTLGIGLCLIAREAKEILSQNKAWKESGLEDLAEAFHRNDVGKVLVFSAFSAVDTILQDCCSARPSYAALLTSSVRNSIRNKICRRIKSSLLKYSDHSGQHFRQVLGVALECANITGEPQAQNLAKQLVKDLVERTPHLRKTAIDTLSNEYSKHGSVEAASLLQAILSQQECSKYIEQELSQCLPKKRLFEKRFSALLILSQQDTTPVLVSLANSPGLFGKLSVETRSKVLRAIENSANAGFGNADNLIRCGIVDEVFSDLQSENSTATLKSILALGKNSLSVTQQDELTSRLVRELHILPQESFKIFCEQAEHLITKQNAADIAQLLMQKFTEAALEPEHVTRIASFISASCAKNRRISLIFEKAGLDKELEPWSSWLDIGNQIRLELAIARIREKPLPAEDVVRPWLKKVVEYVQSKDTLDSQRRHWVIKQLIDVQRRSDIWSTSIAAAISDELNSTIPGSPGHKLLTSAIHTLASSSYSGAKALWRAGVQKNLHETNNSELLHLVSLGNLTPAQYNRAIVARAVNLTATYGELKLINNLTIDRHIGRELASQFAEVLDSDTATINESSNVLEAIKNLLQRERFASEPFTQGVLASSIEDALNRQLDIPADFIPFGNPTSDFSFNQIVLDVLEILHQRRIEKINE